MAKKLPEIPEIEADWLGRLVYELATDGMPNDAIASNLGVGISKIETTLSDIRKRGNPLDRPAMTMDRMQRIIGYGAVVSANLRRMTNAYEELGHPRPSVVAARRIGEAIGRSDGWVNAVAAWYRQGVSEARVELGGKLDESVAELRELAHSKLRETK